MSEPIGETFVTITPIVDEAAFKEKTEAAVRNATSNVTPINVPINIVGAGGQGANGLGSQTQDIANLLRERQAAFEASTQAEASAATASAKLLIGASTSEEATAALAAYTVAAEAAAKADIALTVASGTQTDTFGQSVKLLQQKADAEALAATATREHAVAMEQAAAAGAAENASVRGLRSQSFRTELKDVVEGRSPAAELFSPATLLRFGAAGLAIEGIFSTVNHLEGALKTTGDEAFTTEGRLRNLGAALLKGDVVEAVKAIGDQAETSDEKLKKLAASGTADEASFRALAQQAEHSSIEIAKFADAQDKLGHSDFANALKEAAKQEEDAAQGARDMAAAFLLAGQASTTMAAQIKHAGSDAAQFGERVRGPGDVPQILTPRGDTGGTTDTTATTDTANQIARANADTLKQQLTQARAEAKQTQDRIAIIKDTGGEGLQAARAKLAEQRRTIRGFEEEAAKDAEKDVVDRQAIANRIARANAASLQQQLTEARTEAVQITARIAGLKGGDQNKLLEARADLAEKNKEIRGINDQIRQEQEQAAQDRQDAFQGELDNREANLQQNLALAQSRTVGLGDDRKALQALISFEHEKSLTRSLDIDARRSARRAEKEYRDDLRQLGKQQTEQALDIRRQTLQNDIDAAKLTKGEDDDKRAQRVFLAFLEGNLRRARGNAEAFQKARAELLSFRLSLKDQAAQGGFGPGDFFKAAVENFDAFGSNIGGAGTILSRQDARASAAQGIISRAGGRDPNLTEAEKQTALLTSIDQKLSGGGARDTLTAAEKRRVVSAAGNLGGFRAAQEAADNVYGAD